MKKAEPDLPIFFDVSGKRWRRLKLGAFLCLFALLGVTIWEGYRVSSLENISRLPDASVSAAQLADKLSHTNIPVIGTGPLARVIEIDDGAARPLYSRSAPRVLASSEVEAVGAYDFAIERYGGSTAGKRIVLTFDDGPDPVYTNQLLNILSKEGVPATFFVVGKSVVDHPEIVKRIVKEGHGIANHSFTHADMETAPGVVVEQEINLTQRAIRSVSGYDTTFVRPPYVGIGDQSLRNSIHGILHAQRLGHTVALYDFDTSDWQQRSKGTSIELPPFDGGDKVLLLHDGGGNRAQTLVYVQRLIREARKQGYGFATMHSLYPSEPSYFQPVNPSLEDQVTTGVIQAATVWPLRVVWALFLLTVVFVFIGLVLYSVLAIVQKRRTRFYEELEDTDYQPSVTVVVPAYNEEKVLKNCIERLQKCSYPHLRIIIVDDGSSDGTLKVARRLARKYENTKAFHQKNAGKAAATNLAIRRTWSPVIIGIDADTVFLPDTISRLVRHFKNPAVGAVAGMVQVGNRSNMLGWCQALEYTTSIALERTAQASLGAIMVVPGACGAWRRTAIVAAGRYSSATLAEDCDLTLGVKLAGYDVLQDNTAIAATEVPLTLRSFARQRFRWAFGNLQVYWKYRRYLLHGKRDWLNSLVMPLAIVSIIGPVFFLPLLGFITLSNLLNGNYVLILIFSTISLVFLLVRAYIALRLSGEGLRYLWIVPVARALYGPLRVYLIYGTLLRAFRGDAVGWNKLSRAGLALQASRTRKTPLLKAKT